MLKIKSYLPPRAVKINHVITYQFHSQLRSERKQEIGKAAAQKN